MCLHFVQISHLADDVIFCSQSCPPSIPARRRPTPSPFRSARKFTSPLEDYLFSFHMLLLVRTSKAAGPPQKEGRTRRAHPAQSTPPTPSQPAIPKRPANPTSSGLDALRLHMHEQALRISSLPGHFITFASFVYLPAISGTEFHW